MNNCFSVTCIFLKKMQVGLDLSNSVCTFNFPFLGFYPLNLIRRVKNTFLLLPVLPGTILQGTIAKMRVTTVQFQSLLLGHKCCIFSVTLCSLYRYYCRKCPCLYFAAALALNLFCILAEHGVY